jgi:hypothetical protein
LINVEVDAQSLELGKGERLFEPLVDVVRKESGGARGLGEAFDGLGDFLKE